jgi:lysophospholipase L1-like esterase
VCLGDSLTYGYPYGPHASWVAYLSKISGLNFFNAGINGHTMEDMADRFGRDVLVKNPEVVVILGGTNDAYQEGVSRAMTVSFLEQILAGTVANHIRPVIGMPMPVDNPAADRKLERITEEYRMLAAKLGVPVLDFRTAFIDPDTKKMREELYIDDAHPNLDGYRVMGETAAAFFQTFLPAGEFASEKGKEERSGS